MEADTSAYQGPKVSSPAAHPLRLPEQDVSPWSVMGKVGENGVVKLIGHNKLVEKFGTKLIDDALLERLKGVTGHKPHCFHRRRIVFSHRGLELNLDRHERGNEKDLIGGVEHKVEEYDRFARENAKDIVAVGFDPDKTFIFSNYPYMGGEFYRNTTRIAKVCLGLL